MNLDKLLQEGKRVAADHQGMAIAASRTGVFLVVNVVAVFGAIHFYTQWFERLGASAETVLIAGLLALGLAIGLRALNIRLDRDEA